MTSKENFEFYCEHQLSLRTSVSSLRPFKLFDYQKYISRLLDKKKHVIVVSPRQMGMTTVSLARAFWEIQVKDNIKVVILFNSNDQTKNADNIINYWISNHQFINKSIYSGGLFRFKAGHIKFIKTNSELMCVSINSQINLQGLQNDLLIFDNLSCFNYKSTTSFYSLLASVKPNGKTLIYSTPTSQDLFRNLFIDACHGRNIFYAYRIPWQARPGNTLEWISNMGIPDPQLNKELFAEFD